MAVDIPDIDRAGMPGRDGRDGVVMASGMPSSLAK